MIFTKCLFPKGKIKRKPHIKSGVPYMEQQEENTEKGVVP